MEIMKPALLRAAAAAALSLGFVACKSNTPPPARPAVPPVQPLTPPTAQPEAQASPSTPDMLARKTATYAQELEARLAQRRAHPPAAKTEPGDAQAALATSAAANAVQQANAAVKPPAAKASSVAPNDSQALAAASPTHPADVSHDAAPDAADSPSEVKAAVDTGPASANQVASLTAPSAAAVPQLRQSDLAARAPIQPSTGGDLQQKLTQRMKEHPRDVAAQLDYQLLQFISDESVPDMRAMAPLPQEDRELVTAILDGLSNFRSGVRADNNMLLSKKVRPLLDLADRLRSQSDLTIPTVALCKRVDGFGVYDPIEPARFGAGREHPVIIYSEVANFDSHRNSNKQWETKLTVEEVLYTESGMSVWPDKPDTKTITDLSRNRRHDFFVVKVIHLPATLTIGRYLLKVTITDQQANRVAEATVPIVITAE
jgi:hypothetical protein